MSTDSNIDLAEIPGLGPVRRAALAEAGVGDLRGLLAMKLNELAAVRGVGIWQARKIREFLRQRGLLVEDGTAPGEDGPIVVSAPATPEQASIVAEAVHAFEEQAEAEAQVEAEVAVLVEAIEQSEPAPRSPGRSRKRAAAAPVTSHAEAGSAAPVEAAESETAAQTGAPPADTDGESGEDDAPKPAADATGDDEVDAEEAAAIRNELGERRERLPESALALVEAIRQAAVSKQLTRQITRLLITAGDFSDDDVRLTLEHRRSAASVLASVEQSLQKALEKESFGKKAQRDLAERVRARRKELERLLQETESDA